MWVAHKHNGERQAHEGLEMAKRASWRKWYWRHQEEDTARTKENDRSKLDENRQRLGCGWGSQHGWKEKIS